MTAVWWKSRYNHTIVLSKSNSFNREMGVIFVQYKQNDVPLIDFMKCCMNTVKFSVVIHPV